MILIFCENEKQQAKAIKVNKMNGKKVECSKTNGKKYVKGVVTEIPVNVSVDEVKASITNANVIEIKCLRTNRSGSDSLSIMVIFNEVILLKKILIGYMCYDVRL